MRKKMKTITKRRIKYVKNMIRCKILMRSLRKDILGERNELSFVLMGSNFY